MKNLKALTTRNVLGLVTVLILFIVSCWFGLEAFRMNREFSAARFAEPFEQHIPIDEPGVHTFPVQVSFRAAHGLMFYGNEDNLGNLVSASENTVPVYRGLSGAFVFKDKQGEVLGRHPFHEAEHFEPDGRFLLARSSGLVDLDHVDIEIASTPDNADIKELRVSASYQLCGCEQIPVVLSGMGSLSTAFVGGLGLLILIPAGFRKPRPQETAGDDAP